VGCIDGHEYTHSVQDRRLDVATAHDGCNEWANIDFTYVTDRVLLIISFGYNLILLSICSLTINPENDDARGDSWNGEIFSWFGNSRVTPCASEKTLGLGLDLKELYSGGRILDAVARPYAAKTAGVPL